MRNLFKVFIVLILLLLVSASALATDVSISGFQSISNYQYPGQLVYLRIFSSDTFTTSDGKVVVGSASGTTGFYLSISCTIASNTVTCPAFTLPSTIDSSRPSAGFTGILFDSHNNQKETLFTKWHLDKTPTAITYKDWESYNLTKQPPLGDGYYTKAQLDIRFAALALAPKATDGVYGTGRLSKSADNLADPVFVGKNDLSTTSNAGVIVLAADGEGAAGKAVQGSDSRLAAASTTNRATVTTTTSNSQAVSTDDPRMTDARTPIGLAGGDLQGSYPNPTVKPPVVTNGTALEGYGDSIEANFNASPSSNGYANLVAASVGWTITNHGVAGSQCGDQAAVIYTKSIGLTVNENYLLHDGIGDEIHYAADANKQSVFQACYLAQLYGLAIPDALKLKASNAGITYTGAWAAATIPYDAKFTYVAGATAQATVVGNAVYVGSLVQTGITAASYTINVDGTDYGTYDTGPPGGVNVTTSGFNLSFFPVLRRVSLPTFGAHLVIVTATAASVGHPVYLTQIAGNGGLVGAPVLNASLPSVYALTILRQSAAGYVTYGGSDARVAIYNQMIQDDAALVRQDGFNIALFDLTYAINPETDLDDNLHPNNAGHLKIANALVSRMRRSPFINSITGSDSFDFTALAANTCEVLTSVKPVGADVGDVVNIGLPDTLVSESNRTVFTAWISAASTLSIRRCNVTGTITTNPASATIKFEVRKF